jgi:predicted RecB family nuclease
VRKDVKSSASTPREENAIGTRTPLAPSRRCAGCRRHRPSALGAWGYEAWDTKLAHRAKPYFVLQLCFYTEQLARIQCLIPDDMVIVLDTGEIERLHYREFDAYDRAVRARFLEATRTERTTYPYPVEHCTLCEYQADCNRRWEVDDHLSLVANIRRDQVETLTGAAITTVAALASVDDTARLGIGQLALRRLTHQARLQAEQCRTGAHRYDLLPLDERTGIRFLPKPSEGDIFFDLEGDPYFEPRRGLEYRANRGPREGLSCRMVRGTRSSSTRVPDGPRTGGRYDARIADSDRDDCRTPAGGDDRVCSGVDHGRRKGCVGSGSPWRYGGSSQ